MNSLSPSNRPREPLRVWMMALALVLAAIVGAGLGFLLDLAGPSAAQEEAEAPPP